MIIGFHDKPGYAQKKRIQSHRGRIQRTHATARAIVASLPEEEIDKIKKDPLVAYVEEDAIIQAVDPVPAEEWPIPWSVQRIGANLLHDIGIKGQGVKIGIIDTGIDYTHEAFQHNYRGGYDFVFDDDDPYDDSYNSHGTHVAGIIAARSQSADMRGIAPEASLYAVKALDGAGFAMLSWIIAGIEWSIENGMDIINISFGTTRDFQSLKAACDRAFNEGILIVAAAGNTYGGEIGFPARYASVLAVAATDPTDQIARLSAAGKEIELVAPGMSILSPVSGGYDSMSGTSQAAPHVTGTAALFLSTGYLPDLDKDGTVTKSRDLRLALRWTALDLGIPGRDELYGFGLVNSEKAVTAVVAAQTRNPQRIPLFSSGDNPRLDARKAVMGGAVYRLSIKNDGLSKLEAWGTIYGQGAAPEKKVLTHQFHQEKKDYQFCFDLTNKEVEVLFIPYGQSGAAAEITLSREPGGRC